MRTLPYVFANNINVFGLFVLCFRIQTEPKLLPQVEEVTYAEPVLMPQPPPKGPPSPRNTLRKPSLRDPCEPREPRDARNLPPGNADILFQYQTDGGYNARDYRARDNFGTLRSHQVINIKTHSKSSLNRMWSPESDDH